MNEDLLENVFDLERPDRRQQTQTRVPWREPGLQKLSPAFPARGALVKVPISWLYPECLMAASPSALVIQWAKSKITPLNPCAYH